ncbi:hypothetical protein WKW79_29040 [Variovorax robiniae]|uniref:CHAT domain-containing protein n=1 Tax=Variovorax robiniae TaxID=1836199 RepID=A0ABU8XGI8_9BURK
MMITTPVGQPLRCGGCGSRLRIEVVVRALIFDHLHEAPPAIVQGRVNLSRCAIDGYIGRIWPGLLVYDRQRRRSILVVANLEDARDIDATLLEILRLVEAQSGEDLASEVRDRLVLVADYEELTHLLSCEGPAFESELAACKDYERRRAIEDDPERARQFVDDLLNGRGLLLIMGREARPPLLQLIAAEMERQAADAEASEQRRLVLRRSLRTMEPMLQNPHSEPTIRPSAFHADQDRDERAGNLGRLSRELESFVAEQAALLPHRIGDEAAHDELHRALRLLHSHPSVTDWSPSDEAKRERHLESANELIADLVRRMPAIRWQEAPGESGEGQILDVSQAALRALGGDRSLQIAIAEAGATYLEQAGLEEAALAAISFLSPIAAAFGEAEARVCVGHLAAKLCERRGNKPLAMAARAHGLSALYSAAVRQIHSHVLVFLAIDWQALGRWAATKGWTYLAALCAGESAEMCEHAGRMDGALQSRIDAMVELLSMGSDHVERQEVNALREEVDRYAAANPSTDVNVLRRRVRNVSGSHAVAASEKPEIRFFSAGSHEDALFYLPKVVSLSEDGTASGWGRTPAEAQVQPNTIVVTARASPHSPEDVPEVRALVFVDVLWARDFLESADLAAADGDWEAWFASYGNLLDTIESLWARQAGLLSPYLCAAMHQQARLLKVPREIMQQPHMLWREARMVAKALLLRGLRPEQSPEFLKRAQALAATDLAAIPHGDGLYATQFTIECAEVLECAGLHAAAGDVYLQAASRAWLAHQSQVHAGIQSDIRAGLLRSRALYRAARAMAKMYFDREGARFEDIARCLELVEMIKVQATRKTAMPAMDPEAPLQLGELLLPFQKLASAFPADSALLVLSLMQETELNSGFWLWALVFPGKEGKTVLRRYQLDEVYQQHRKVLDSLARDRATVIDAPLAEAPGLLQAHRAKTDSALAGLADLLLPPGTGALLADFGVSQLYLLPEAYLFDVPWAALPIQCGETRKPLHQWGRDGRLRINVLPSWSSCLPREARASRAGPPQALGWSYITRPRWRSLEPIHGAQGPFQRLLGKLGDHLPELSMDTGRTGDTVGEIVGGLRRSRLFVFFGHGDADESTGVRLIADDGAIDTAVIEAASKATGLHCEAALLMACGSLINSRPPHANHREISGIHVAVLQAGARYIVGSSMPMIPAVALRVLEILLDPSHAEQTFDHRLAAAYDALSRDQLLSHPVFWGHIAGFGDGSFTVLDSKERHE